MDAIEKEKSFEEELFENEKVRAILSEEEIKELLKPENYIGLAPQKVDYVLENVRKLGLID